MAIALIEELVENGIRVPEDICVLGFEATQEGALGKTTLTSIESNFAKVGADAVYRIRAVIEPDKELDPYIPDVKKLSYLCCTKASRLFRCRPGTDVLTQTDKCKKGTEKLPR